MMDGTAQYQRTFNVEIVVLLIQRQKQNMNAFTNHARYNFWKLLLSQAQE